MTAVASVTAIANLIMAVGIVRMMLAIGATPVVVAVTIAKTRAKLSQTL